MRRSALQACVLSPPVGDRRRPDLPQIARYGSFSRRISAMHPGMPQVRLPGGRQLVRAVGTLLGWGFVSMGPMHEFSQG